MCEQVSGAEALTRSMDCKKMLDFQGEGCYTVSQLHKGFGRRVNESSLFFVEMKM